MATLMFQGLSLASESAKNPAFSMLRTTEPALSLLGSFATDLTGGKSLVELSAAMVMTNILTKLQVGGGRTYAVVKLVGPWLILAGGVYEFSKRMTFIPVFLTTVRSKVTSYLTGSIVVPASSSLNTDVCHWVAAQGLGTSANSLTLAPPSGTFSFDDSEDQDNDFENLGLPQNPLNYTASLGQSSSRFKGYRMMLDRKEAAHREDPDGKLVKVEAGLADPTQRQNITLTCFPTLRGAEPIKEFLDHVKGFAAKCSETSTEVYRPEKGYCGWDWNGCYRPTRALEGVVMETALKKSLLDDIKFYLSSQCRKFYQNRGIPYRRGYLLYGPPGTGKTSFATAIAGHFNLPVYILTLTDLNDKSLADLFNEMPMRACLLLEDIDSAGLRRDDCHASGGKSGSKNKKKKEEEEGVTLSGLLNCLDGPASLDGRLLLMTSNPPDNLDPALVRPGRCDRKILFGYVCPEVSAQLFTNIYTKCAEELYEDEANAADVHDIPALAAEFASKIPIDSAITPAECQAWLLANRLDPLAAVNGAVGWAREIIENKLRGANVATFTNEVKSITDSKSLQLKTPPSSVDSCDSSDDDFSDGDSECDDSEGDDSEGNGPDGDDTADETLLSLRDIFGD